MSEVLIYTSGDREHGLGHVCRQIHLAEELLSRRIGVSFEIPPDTPGWERILAWRGERKNVWINDYSRKGHNAIVIDLEHGPSEELLQEARRKYRRVVVVGGVGFPIVNQKVIDDLVDLQVYQSVIVTNPVSAKNTLTGPDYVIIGKDYLTVRELYGKEVFGNNVLVVMGGADPHNITGVVTEAVSMFKNGHGVHAVFGPASSMGKVAKGTTCFINPPSLAFQFSKARVAVTALGMTTYEAACVGVPTASVCWSEDHSLTADELERQGVTVNLGLWDNPDWNKLKGFMEQTQDTDNWQVAHEAGRRLVDGRGARRVVDAIEKGLQ